MMADHQGGGGGGALMMVGGGGEGLRDYRKGNWTVQETLVLITAKKKDDERRMRKEHGGEAGRSSRPAELRWKWVEDYCWRNGCMRSQNQCNDKWDNLMRDYKKVRDYERRAMEEAGGGHGSSYWNLERGERKDKNLPANLLPEIYEALFEAVETRMRRGAAQAQRVLMKPAPLMIAGVDHDSPMAPPAAGADPAENPPLALTSATCAPSANLQHHQSPHPQHTHSPLPPLDVRYSSDSDGSEHSSSSSKRRRRRRRGEGSSSSSSSAARELNSAISKSATILSEALLECEAQEDRRHRELISVEERRLRIEESKTDVSSQAINGLTAAVNKLATSILTLASDKNLSGPK